jgi:hypothetical protein
MTHDATSCHAPALLQLRPAAPREYCVPGTAGRAGRCSPSAPCCCAAATTTAVMGVGWLPALEVRVGGARCCWLRCHTMPLLSARDLIRTGFPLLEIARTAAQFLPPSLLLPQIISLPLPPDDVHSPPRARSSQLASSQEEHQGRHRQSSGSRSREPGPAAKHARSTTFSTAVEPLPGCPHSTLPPPRCCHPYGGGGSCCRRCWCCWQRPAQPARGALQHRCDP